MHTQLGEEGAPRKVDYKPFGLGAADIDLSSLLRRLTTLARSGACSLNSSHVDPLIAAVARGELKLRGEDLDILRRDEHGLVHPISGVDGDALSIDRNIAHLYFTADGTFSVAFRDERPGSQLLHGVADVMVRTVDRRVLCIQWVHEDPAMRNLGILGGHVPAGVHPLNAAEKEIPEELGWVLRAPAEYRLRGTLRRVGDLAAFPAPNKGDAEAKTLTEYELTDADEIAWVLDERAALDALRNELGDAAFFRNRRALQERAPGLGEIWAIHLLTPAELRDAECMRRLNIGVDLAAYLRHPAVQQALG